MEVEDDNLIEELLTEINDFRIKSDKIIENSNI